MPPKDVAEIPSGKQREISTYQSWHSGNHTSLMNEMRRRPSHPPSCFLRFVMGGSESSSAKENVHFTVTAMNGAVLLQFTPSPPRIAYGITVSSSTPGDNWDAISTSSDSSWVLDAAEKAAARLLLLPLLTHLIPLLSRLISFLSATRSKIL